MRIEPFGITITLLALDGIGRLQERSGRSEVACANNDWCDCSLGLRRVNVTV